MGEEPKSKSIGTYIFWVILTVIVLSGLAKGSENKSYESNNSSSYSSNSYDEEDGYAWAEENDISSFEDCQDQFGNSSEEDECNEYVKENYTGYNTYYGDDCTEDCSGHEAGYNWAEENNIDDEYDCDGNSDSFNEGCESYVEENY
jgi:hypothetical protein